MSIRVSAEATPNNAINADSEKRRAFVAPLFTAGYGEHYASHAHDHGGPSSVAMMQVP